MGWLSRLWGRRDFGPDIDHLVLVEKLSTELPRCSKYVLIESSGYSANRAHDPDVVRCEVSVLASDLLHWKEAVAGDTFTNDKHYKAALEAFPVWLREADLEETNISSLSPAFAEVARSCLGYFVTSGWSRIYCPSCRSYIEGMEKREIDEGYVGAAKCWTEEWTCQEGHLLYRACHDLHIYRGPSRHIRESPDG